MGCADSPCQTYSQFVEEFWDGSLADDDRAMIENHILDCRNCARDFVLRRQLEETPKVVWMGTRRMEADALAAHQDNEAR